MNSPFPNYMQMTQRIPVPVWNGIRIISVGVAIGLVLTLFVRPDIGLFVLWGVIIPFVPLLFFIAPGVWRNICPLAAMNQTPRLFGFTRAGTAPKWFKDYGYVIGIVLFSVIVANRKSLFNTNGVATGLLVLALLTAAFVMGVFFKGKSGWCSSICPLLPVQRIYGQTPFLTVPNSHCQPCVGCTKNCYDFNPKVAYLADMHDNDKYFAAYRKFFVGMFPGFIYAFYTVPNPPDIGLLPMYGMFLLWMLFSAGIFFLADSFIKVTSNKITVLFGATALNLYYWFNSANIASLLPDGMNPVITWGLRALVLGLTLIWIQRTYKKEPIFIDLMVTPKVASVGSGNQSIVAHSASLAGSPEIIFHPDDKRIVTQKGRTILEVAEANDLDIEPGCRMGVCGADPVAIVKGMENLSKLGGDEKGTVERLGLGKNTRMACMARIKGNVTVSLSADDPPVFQSSVVQGFKYDKSVEKVVIIGNGIAGVTTADHVRRRHPLAEIHLVGRESHLLYNRMAITRLIYGRSAMQGLYLMPEKWYNDLKITNWLNTDVHDIDADKQVVSLGTGESLPYDRLILTTGSNSFVPPIDGYGLAGTYVLRTAEEAMDVRRFVQKNRCRQAVVAGGGLLGLEAAFALHKLGMEVVVLERGATLLRRQLDERGGQFLQEYLEGLGMHIVTSAETVAVKGNGRVACVMLKDGREMPADLFLVAAGIRSELTLPKSLGLNTGRGVVVNERMQTSNPNIYAAGDVAEYDGKVMGLWAAAVAQGEVAAANAVGGDETYTEIVPVTMLKVVGIDITSMGRIHAEAVEEVITFEDISNHKYRKLIINNNKIEGAILLGFPQDSPAVAEAVKTGTNVKKYLSDLRAGKWDVLGELLD